MQRRPVVGQVDARTSDADRRTSQLRSPAVSEGFGSAGGREPPRPVAAPRGDGVPGWDAPPRPPTRMVTATGTIPRIRLPESPGLPPLEAGRAFRTAPEALHHEYVGDWGYRPVVPQQIGRGGRAYVMVTFWFMLVVSVELWWLDTPAHSVHGAGAVLTEGGRITGMVAGFVLLAQILLMSRVRWLERWIGAHDLLIWHRELGAALVVLVVRARRPDHVRLRGRVRDLGLRRDRTISGARLGAMISAYIATGDPGRGRR